MSRDNKNNIDELFSNGFAHAEDHVAFDEANWDALEQMLDERKRKPALIFRLPVLISGIAAMLLLTLGFLFLKFEPQAGSTNNLANTKTSTQHITKHLEIRTGQPAPAAHENITGISPRQTKTLLNEHLANYTPLHFNVRAHKHEPKDEIRPASIQPEPSVTGDSTRLASVIEKTTPANTFGSAAVAADSGLRSPVYAALGLALSDSGSQKPAVFAANERRKIEIQKTGFKRPVIISAFVSPDVNSNGSSLGQAKVGSNVGLLFSVGLTAKLSISTGALYSKKPYLVNFSDYHTNYTFPVTPSTVYADCRVLDIPLNIDYQVFRRGVNAVSVGAGISSYFMLQENYSFNYGAGAQGPASYNISNQNKHLFGVANISATYQRRISPKFGLNIQPYMKLPLTDIGYGRINLQSKGVAVGVSWFVNGRKK